tara:strand:- start:594 stop:908 length:315 start_codon:yes stop_codon:yes gene_type:complete
MDYWHSLRLFEYSSWESFLDSGDRPERIHLFTTKADLSLWDVEFQSEDGLLFGNESSGVPPEVHQWACGNRVKIPQFQDGLRSLNLANATAVAAYEALRQINCG